MSGEMGNLVV
jgi:hypothetical protein